MKRYIGALVSAAALSGTLCLIGTGTAQAISGNFSCGAVLYNATAKTIFSATCTGGPLTATSGWATDVSKNITYRCTTLKVRPFTDFFSFVDGKGCNPV